MFTKLISAISQGKIPPTVELKARLQAAIIKKTGVLQQPFLCRANDKKINPAARDMLWAAIILEDSPGVKTVQAIIETELLDRGEKKSKLDGTTDQFIAELLDLAPDKIFLNLLKLKIKNSMNKIPLDYRNDC